MIFAQHERRLTAFPPQRGQTAKFFAPVSTIRSNLYEQSLQPYSRSGILSPSKDYIEQARTATASIYAPSQDFN